MDNTYEVENIIQVDAITSTTLVGVMGEEYPLSRGNCFSVRAIDGDKTFRVVNFGYENLKELLRQGTVSWPLDIIPISERHCVIADHRIPSNWYSDRFCSTCTPQNLLPPQQKLERVLDLKSGKRIEREIDINGEKMIAVSYNVGSKKGLVKIPFKWSVNPVIELREHPDASKDLENEILTSRYKDKTINSDFYTTIKPSEFINNDEDDVDDEDE